MFASKAIARLANSLSMTITLIISLAVLQNVTLPWKNGKTQQGQTSNITLFDQKKVIFNKATDENPLA